MLKVIGEGGKEKGIKIFMGGRSWMKLITSERAKEGWTLTLLES